MVTLKYELEGIEKSINEVGNRINEEIESRSNYFDQLRVTNGLGIDIDGIHGSSVPYPFRCTDCEPPRACSDISDRFAGSNA